MKILTWLVSILTLLLLASAYLFNVKGFEGIITQPQFGNLEFFYKIVDEIERAGGRTLFFYNAFFIIDFIWSALFLLLLYRFVKKWVEGGDIKMLDFHWLPVTMLIFSILAYC